MAFVSFFTVNNMLAVSSQKTSLICLIILKKLKDEYTVLNVFSNIFNKIYTPSIQYSSELILKVL